MAIEKNTSFRDLIIEAQKGNNEAMTEIIEKYMQLVNKHSYIDGRIDEDLRQDILLKIITNIGKFKAWKNLEEFFE